MNEKKKNNSYKKKFWTKKKIIFLIILVLIVGFIIFNLKRCSKQTFYQEVKVEKRDITNYLEFSGNIEAKDSCDVYTDVGAKILEVNVEEGDEVRKGDVLATLDASDVEYNIALKEAQLDSSELQNEYNIKDSATSLANMNQQIDEGLNNSINSAEQSLLSAQEKYDKAVEDYNEAKEDYDNDASSGIVNAKQSLSNAQISLQTQQYNATHDSKGDSLENVNQTYLDNQLLSARTNVSQAQANLETAREEAAEQVQDYYDAMIDAQEALENAEINYNTTLLSVSQNVATTENSLEKTEALADNTTSQMEIDHLKETLSDYVIYAPEDGVVTSLSLKAGSYIQNASNVATITNMDTMQVEISIDEYDLADVSVGDSVQVYINALDKYYEGKIASIASVATTTNSVSYLKAVVEFDASDDHIASGLSAEVKLIQDDEKDALTIPIDTVSYKEDNTAYVLKKGTDGNPVEQAVTLGVSDNSYVQILDGLSEGDSVMYMPSTEDMAAMMTMQAGGDQGGPQGGGDAPQDGGGNPPDMGGGQ